MNNLSSSTRVFSAWLDLHWSSPYPPYEEVLDGSQQNLFQLRTLVSTDPSETSPLMTWWAVPKRARTAVVGYEDDA